MEDRERARHREWMNKRYQERGKYLRKVQQYVEEAKARGVCFLYEEYSDDMYLIRVVGEKGGLKGIPLRRLPAMIHGLFLMGEKLRAMRMSYKWVEIQGEGDKDK